MFGTEMKPLMDAARKFVADTIDDQMEQAELEIAAQHRKIKRLKQQRALFEKAAAELAKPPKAFKISKLTKKQRKELERIRRLAVPTAVMPPAVGM
jgi:hypothetical protein